MNTKLNLNAGNLPSWAAEQASRLASLRAFQPTVKNGFARNARLRSIKAISRQLEAAGVTGTWKMRVCDDILDLVRLEVNAQ